MKLKEQNLTLYNLKSFTYNFIINRITTGINNNNHDLGLAKLTVHPIIGFRLGGKRHGSSLLNKTFLIFNYTHHYAINHNFL